MDFIYFNPQEGRISDFHNLMKVEESGFDSQGKEHRVVSYPLLPTDDDGKLIDLPVLVYDPNKKPYYYDPDKRWHYGSDKFLSQYSNYIQPGTLYFIPATYFPDPSHRLEQGVNSYLDLIDAPQFYVKHIMFCVVAKDERGRTVFVTIEAPPNYSVLTKYIDTEGKDDRFFVFGISKLKFPDGISLNHQAAYNKNIITMAALLATYSEFPDISGNKADLIGIDSPNKVQEAAEMALLCVYGDDRGKTWMRDEVNTMYCSEMLSASIETGLNFLLTPSNLRQVAQKYFPQAEQETFVVTVARRINTGDFLDDISMEKRIPYGHYLKGLIGLVDSDSRELQPFDQTLGITANDDSGLVMKPDTYADVMFRYFLRFYPYQDLSGLEGQEQVRAIRYNEAVKSLRLQKFAAITQLYQVMYKAFLEQANHLKQWIFFKVTFEVFLKQKNTPSLDVVQLLLQKSREFALSSDRGVFMLPMKWLGSNITKDNLMKNQGKIDFEPIAWLMPRYAFYRYLVKPVQDTRKNR